MRSLFVSSFAVTLCQCFCFLAVTIKYCLIYFPAIVLELQRLRSLFALKHQQLSDATARVDMLTKQLGERNHSGVLGNTVGETGEEIPRDQDMSKVGQSEHQV